LERERKKKEVKQNTLNRKRKIESILGEEIEFEGNRLKIPKDKLKEYNKKYQSLYDKTVRKTKYQKMTKIQKRRKFERQYEITKLARLDPDVDKQNLR
jgi:hypothetical protein